MLSVWYHCIDHSHPSISSNSDFGCITILVVHDSTFCGTGTSSVVSSELPSAKPSQQPVTPEQSSRSDRRSSPRSRHREPVHPLAGGDVSKTRSMCKMRDLKTLLKCSVKKLFSLESD